MNLEQKFSELEQRIANLEKIATASTAADEKPDSHLSTSDVSLINKIINIFENEKISYQKSISILPHVEYALKQIALSDKVKR